MKKSLIILTILLLLPIISSVEFDMKQVFDQGETLIARVSGNFLEPTSTSKPERHFFLGASNPCSFYWQVSLPQTKKGGSFLPPGS